MWSVVSHTNIYLYAMLLTQTPTLVEIVFINCAVSKSESQADFCQAATDKLARVFQQQIFSLLWQISSA